MALQDRLHELGFSERKSLVTLCRAQYVPTRSEAKLLAYQAFGSHAGVEIGRETPVRKLAKDLQAEISSSLWSGLVLDITRGFEPTQEEVKEIMVKSWWKEVAACNSERRPSTLNYDAIVTQCT